MSSHLKKEDALAHVKNYRVNLPANSNKCFLLNQEIIDFIVANADSLAINGLRVYLSKYKRGYYPVTEQPDLENKLSIVVVPTTLENGVSTDLDNGYFNLAAGCPSTCAGDQGDD